MRSSILGDAGLRVEGGAGWVLAAAYMMAVRLSPSKGGAPVSVSYITTPSEKMSERWSIALPTACSGDMYRGEPMTTPATVFTAEPGMRAMPKSVIFANAPFGRLMIMMLEG